MERVTVSETKSFHKLFGKMVGESDRLRLHTFLIDNPEIGVIIRGTNGLRKLRWARPGIGKRGGVRIIYYYYAENSALYLLTLYAKNDKEDLSPDDRKMLIRKIEEIKQRGKYNG